MKTKLQAGAALMDVPWWGQGAPYETISRRRLMEFPLVDFVAEDSQLFMWTPSNHLVSEAIAFAEQNGFTLRGVITWFKGRAGRPTRYLQANTELLLFFTRGDAPARVRGVGTAIFAPTELHSQKPAETYAMVEKTAQHGPYVEFFARTNQPGWESWGLELETSGIAVDGWPVSSDFLGEVRS